jgi:hypothetical protein
VSEQETFANGKDIVGAPSNEQVHWGVIVESHARSYECPPVEW